jgi:RNA polymerase sigma factor (sigma-70 family)
MILLIKIQLNASFMWPIITNLSHLSKAVPAWLLYFFGVYVRCVIQKRNSDVMILLNLIYPGGGMYHHAVMAQPTINIPGGLGVSSPPDFNAAILKIARNADKQAFVELFEYFAPRIKSYLIKGGMTPDMADEMAQETMLAIWRGAGGFDPRKASASTWIFTIARNKRIDALRRRAGHDISLDTPGLPDFADTAPTLSDVAINNDETQKIAAALRTLPPDQADLIRESFFEGKSHGEIAAAKKIPLGTVKSRLRLALDRLRKQDNIKELWQ